MQEVCGIVYAGEWVALRRARLDVPELQVA